MRKSKRFLSVILAVLMAFSSMTVGFVALAAETAESGDAEEKSAVTEMSDAIIAFHNNKYNTLMFSTKEAEAEQKAEAIKAFDALCAQLKALTDAEKLELSLSNYMYVLSLAADQVGRAEGLSSNNAKVNGTTVNFNKVTEKIGALPAEYQTAYDAVKALYVKVDNTLFNSSFDFKAHNDGYAHLETCLEQIKKLSPAAISFANYASPYGDGFYLYCSSPTGTASYIFSNIESNVFNYNQDKMTESGKNPTLSYTTFLERKRVDGVYVTTWKPGYDGAVYKASYEKFGETLQSDVTEPSKAAYEMLLDIFSAVYGKELKDAGVMVLEKGLSYYNTNEITVAEINEVLNAINALSKDGQSALSSVMGYYNLKVVNKLIFPIEYTAETTAEEVYKNQVKTEYKTVANLLDAMKDILSQLQFEEFTKALNAVDLSKLDDVTVENITVLYAALPSAYKNKLTTSEYGKFMQIVKPAADDYDFAQEVASFKTVPVNRAAIGGDVIWTKEGVQSAVDGTWSLVKTVLTLAKVDVDLSDGLNGVLNDNLYQASVINAIYDLYANLSHNETETGVGMVPTIGSVISMLISKGGIRDQLVQDDNRYAAAIAKIDALSALTDEEKAEGINDLDKIAAIDFTDADFGFKNGDKEGFIDALLAALRPLTYLLSGDNGILGVAGVKIRMFDSVDAEGVYGEDGIYAMLLPLLEQVGLTDLPTPVEYRTNYYAVRETMGKNLGYDEILRPVINSLFKNIVQPVADDPLNGLIPILPRIAYVLNTNMVNDTVKAVITSTGNTLAGLAGGLDLSAGAVNNMITNAAISFDVNGETYTIKLKPIDWNILQDCATVSAVKSSSNENAYVLLRTGDVDSCFTNVFYYLYEVLFADKDNFTAVNALLNSVVSGQVLSIVMNIVKGINTGNKFSSYAAYLKLRGKAGPTQLPREKSDVQKKFIDLGNHVIYDEYVAYTSIYNAFIAGTNPPKYTEFSPTTAITRAMFVAILYRMAGNPYDDANPHKTNPFTDISTDAYYYNAACWALDEGITNQTTFKPYDNVTREQTARFLFAYAEANDMLGNEDYKNVDLSTYPDYKNVSEWAKEPLRWANYNNMITGTQQGYINPQGATQRIHATRILYGFGKACKIGNFTANNF